MAKKKGAKEVVLLQCTESGELNYSMYKDKKKHPERMEIKKYCPRLRKHTLHKEIKK